MRVLLLLIAGLTAAVYCQDITTDCSVTDADVELVAKVVFTYGIQDLTEEEKSGIAFTVVNRVDNPHFPNTTAEVVNWEREVVKGRKTKRWYAKLTKRWSINRWNRAKSSNSADYQMALQLARNALCRQVDDPSGGATDFSNQPTPRFFHAPRNYRASELGTLVGRVYFFNIQPNSENRGSGHRPNGRPGGRRPGGRRPGGGGRGRWAGGNRGGAPGRRGRRPGGGRRPHSRGDPDRTES